MTEIGSSSHNPISPEPVVANAPDTPGPAPIEQGDPEFIAALGIIVSAFVDLGFGVSAAQQAQRAANENRNLVRIAADFPNQSS
ncbi:hypothetical protein [Salipiger sp. PrR007]|uniref:hypothetical protein n=1 Tax=Salipiger sp. PrR007 TaxID=2706884 RepID=UPI0013B6B217|nr:hypothetical protein [Salipiger sp. PrR007]NDW34427.1 hypothetical protein [Salipiger sp. PrR007]